MTVRSTIKSAVSAIGLLPLFWALRRWEQRTVKFLLLLPLRLLMGVCTLYVWLIWHLRPGWKYVKDYLPSVVGRSAKAINLRGSPLIFYTPNSICQYRADTFWTKEPETLAWIDEFGKNGILCDVGANVGTYSIYHAMTNSMPAYACEPAMFNLPLLVKNIHANHMEGYITVVPCPLTAKCGQDFFKLTSTDEGGACSAFGVDYGHMGQTLCTNFSYMTYGATLDSLIPSVLKDVPNLIKLDVDGIEHLILAGAKQTLSSPSCRSVLVEIDERFEMQAVNIKAILTECGFTFREKRRSPLFSHLVNEEGKDIGCYNHIWVKR